MHPIDAKSTSCGVGSLYGFRLHPVTRPDSWRHDAFLRRDVDPFGE
jgi:hypothetical protein